MSPDRTGIHQVVAGQLNTRLEEWPAWPARFLKLQLETAGIHQNETGLVMNSMRDNGGINKVRHQIGNQKYPFATLPGVDDLDGEPIVEHTERMYDFFYESAEFANLTAYVALCQIYEELSGYIDMDVLPERSYPLLLPHAGDGVPDALLRFPGEWVPVEVYNGANYPNEDSSKYHDVLNLSSDDSADTPANPILINRRSDDTVRDSIRRSENGMVVDTDCIITTESLYNEYEDVIDLFGIGDLIYSLPEIEVADGETLDGRAYDQLSGDSDAAEKLRPPAEMLTDVDNLPDQYMRRIRGGVQLLYVNSLYRQTDEPIRKDACYVVQTLYNQLLREGGKERSAAIRDAWSASIDQWNRIRQIESEDGDRKTAVLDEVRSIVTRLQNERIIFLGNGQIYARKASHPQTSLSF
jgi:hypothetical protein